MSDEQWPLTAVPDLAAALDEHDTRTGTNLHLDTLHLDTLHLDTLREGRARLWALVRDWEARGDATPAAELRHVLQDYE